MLNMLNVLFGFGGAMNGRMDERDLVIFLELGCFRFWPVSGMVGVSVSFSFLIFFK